MIREAEVAVALAREHGLGDTRAEVLHAGSSVIVRLAPGGPVARVGGMTAVVRDVRAHFEREVAIAAWLAGRGAPVVSPYEPAGPFERDGYAISLWREAAGGEPPAGHALGTALRRCHDALREYRADLPPVTFLLEEAARLLPRTSLPAGDRALLERALRRAAEGIAAAGLPVQVLHGDAGLGNALPGPVWHDWEDCCIGPIAWDLACLVSTARILDVDRPRAEAALAAYGDAPGAEMLETFVRARGAQVAAWSAFAAEHADRPRERTRRRLEWLREQDWG